MMLKFLTVPRILVLLAVSMPTVAQYVKTPPPTESSAASTSQADELHLYPKNGQTQEQQWADRYECHRWAKNQSGFDPTQQASGAPSSQNASGREGYRRAMTACLEGRGYAVRYGAPPQSAAPAPPAEPARIKQYPPAASGFKYRPLAVHIDFGYSITAGTTNQYLDGGPNVGFGLTWFPTSALPLGLRIDGSYSRFSAKDSLLDLYGGGFTSGHQNIYGGDAGLQLDLALRSSRAKMYLFGGAGWYREQTYLRQVSLEYGTFCDPYFCASGYLPVLTASQRNTSPWHSSWNAGIGLEVSTDETASFFIEARYQSISLYNSKMQFVPIRVGLRF
jgi:Outer membrane protein beta-barrel domain